MKKKALLLALTIFLISGCDTISHFGSAIISSYSADVQACGTKITEGRLEILDIKLTPGRYHISITLKSSIKEISSDDWLRDMKATFTLIHPNEEYIKTKTKETGALSDLSFSINEDFNAIKEYQGSAVFAITTQNDKLKKILLNPEKCIISKYANTESTP